ncbi:MAG: lipopolysaccharide transport periplasmic protein LptA [Gammaproteobacteria bacterium]|nr:MAG: lipopolysaccharide transport periplasmic protein LptA [Gammaproteobacteria bacterium]
MKSVVKLFLSPVAALLALTAASPTMAFDLNSETPILVSADNARLDDSSGIATYTGTVELTQGKTRLTADTVTLYRDDNGLSRIEAAGSPAHYRQPTRDGDGETDAKALRITWSASDRELTFEREAVIEQDGNLFRGDIIHYDTVRRVVTAEGGTDSGNGRVEMVIQPRSTKQGSDGNSESQ